MRICVNKQVLGTEKHLTYDGDEYGWTTDIPSSAWLWGWGNDELKSLEPICKLLSPEIKFIDDESTWQMWRTIGSPKNIPWSKALAPGIFKDHLQKFVDKLWMIFSTAKGTYYLNEFYDIRMLTRQLGRAYIDQSVFNSINNSSTNQTNKSVLRTFLPDGLCARRPIYSQTSTVTGRLTIVDGPNMLILKKEQRRILTSRYSHGVILEIDFKTLEPRVLLEYLGIKCPEDIYTFIGDKIFDKDYSRVMIKTLVLGVIYGLSSSRFIEKFPKVGIDESRELIKKIRKFFHIDDLEKALLKSSQLTGEIRNIYGRRIDVKSDLPYVIVNRFIQSSAADAALLAFASFCKKLKERNMNVTPLFLVHDAILLDVASSELKSVHELIQNGLYIEKIDKYFPVTCSALKDSYKHES